MLEKTFNTGTISINYVEGSPGGLPFLLLHGLFSKWKEFYSLITDFKEDWHVYAFDLRGHGKSSRAESYRIQDYLSDTVSLIKNHIKEPTVLFGRSFGGMIAIMVAAYHPELVKGLIIGDSLISEQYLKEFSENQKDKVTFWRALASTGSVDTIISELKNELMVIPGRDDPVPAY